MAAAIFNVHRKPDTKAFTPADFMPRYGLPEPQAATPIDNSEQLRQLLLKQSRG